MSNASLALDFINVLCALTLIAPLDAQCGYGVVRTISPDEMTASDVLDARDAWQFFFDGDAGQVTYLPDGRAVVKS